MTKFTVSIALVILVFATSMAPAGVVTIGLRGGGELNGEVIDAANYRIDVLPNQLIEGTVNITASHDDPTGAVWPVDATVTWGDRETQWWVVNSNIPSGTNDLVVHVNKTAPEIPGLYHIVMAMTPHYTAEQVMSATSASFGPGPAFWYDGNDHGWDWTDAEFQSARENGYVEPWPIRMPPEYPPTFAPGKYGATWVEVNVVPEPSTVVLLVMGALGLLVVARRKRSREH